MNRIAFAILAACAGFAAGCGDSGSSPTNAVSPNVQGDVIPPTVSMTGPASGAVVAGAFTVSATASDNVGVIGVQWQADGTNLGAELSAPPYSVTVNSSALSNGSHVFAAIARDAAGNRATASTSVAVYNPLVTDVTYCTGDTSLKLDVYYPPRGSAAPLPAIVYIHGGAWQFGDKNAIADGRVLADERTELNRRGYVVFSVNYRLAPAHIYPAFVQDVKCSVRYVRSQAAYYGVDPNHIGAWGESAGGHLSAMLGVVGNGTLEGDGGYAGVSSRVQAVVDYYGPTDLTIFQEWNDVSVVEPNGQTLPSSSAVQAAFGALPGSGDPVLVAGSPVSYVSADDPPFLIFHGTADTEVDQRQSQHLYDKLTAAGVSAQLVHVVGAGHGFGTPTIISPTHAQIVQMMADFFDANLKGGTSR